MKYELKQYDFSLLKFEYLKDTFNGETTHIISVNEDYRYLLPLGMEQTDEGLFKWLKERVIPKNRAFVHSLLSKMGLNQKDTLGIINICKGLSLNDAYWIVEENFTGLFKDYNLFENKFNRTLSLLAYTGYGSSAKSNFASSPEFTTNGMLRKGWRRLQGEVYLYKGGTSGFANSGNEPFSEHYASLIADKMGLDHVDYDLARWKNGLCCKCKLFTDINTSYVPMYKVLKTKNLIDIGDYLKTLGNEFYDSFVDMLIFDCLICNEDRHMGNFGLLVDNKTNKPIKFAPIFDNGLSLFNYAMDDDFDNLIEYSKTRVPFLAESFDEIAKLFITKRQKEQLRKLINFKFNSKSSYKMSSKKVKSIEKYLQYKVNYLLNI